MDRNFVDVSLDYKEVLSLSARRAWIEIIDYVIDYATDASLSARRAWIEIKYVVKDSDFSGSRSPQGERG